MKVSILGSCMGARIAQPLLIRHPELVAKAVLSAPDPGGTHQVRPAEAVAARLNNPSTPKLEKIALTFSPTSGASGLPFCSPMAAPTPSIRRAIHSSLPTRFPSPGRPSLKAATPSSSLRTNPSPIP